MDRFEIFLINIPISKNMASKLPATNLPTRIWNDLEPKVSVNLNFSQVPPALIYIFIALLESHISNDYFDTK